MNQKIGSVLAVIAFVISIALLEPGCGKSSDANNVVRDTNSTSNAASSEAAVDLSASQLNAIKIEPVGTHLFAVQKGAVGRIDFDENLLVQVFPNAQGKLLKTFAQLGDEVKKGQPLYTVDSPDLVTAESTLIGAAATFDLTHKELARAQNLYSTNFGVSERELEQAKNDQQTAEGTLRAARASVRIFGKTEAQIDQIIASRQIDPALVVMSPISGRVTAMNAAPGYLIQPGTAPAPYSVADVSIKWMLANAPESDSPLFKAGQPIDVKVMAFGDRIFKGTITNIYETIDPTAHTELIRSEIADPNNELLPGMLANFVISVHDPITETAVPANAVVREGDGTMTAWVTSNRQHFVERTIKIGLRENGMVQVLAGLQPGELVVSDGAVFLSNMLYAPPSD